VSEIRQAIERQTGRGLRAGERPEAATARAPWGMTP
jgi:hypothetical protein